MAQVAKQATRSALDSMLPKMAKLQSEIKELESQYGELKEQAFPLVEEAGDTYELDGIKAQIIRSQTWDVDATRLLDKFGAKVHALLAVSASKFRKVFEAGMLGTQTDLRGIAKLVDETPKFRLTQK